APARLVELTRQRSIAPSACLVEQAEMGEEADERIADRAACGQRARRTRVDAIERGEDVAEIGLERLAQIARQVARRRNGAKAREVVQRVRVARVLRILRTRLQLFAPERTQRVEEPESARLAGVGGGDDHRLEHQTFEQLRRRLDVEVADCGDGGEIEG